MIDKAPDPAAACAAYGGMAALKRMARTDEIAGLVAYLAADEAAFVSGAEFVIDGATAAPRHDRGAFFLASADSAFMTGAELVMDGGWIAQSG